MFLSLTLSLGLAVKPEGLEFIKEGFKRISKKTLTCQANQLGLEGRHYLVKLVIDVIRFTLF